MQIAEPDVARCPASKPCRNDQVPWDKFDSGAYLSKNYKTLRDDDRMIMEVVRDFFADSAKVPDARALDVGSGTNLYPVLAMLPFCDRLDLVEISASNVAWLDREIKEFSGFSATWDDFWRVYTERDEYAHFDPRVEIARKAEIWQDSVFKLPARRWDLGTMFFVACSLSTEETEFRAALHRFIGALRHGAPLAAAFMVNSTGYQVGDWVFPAVDVNAEKVEQALASVAYDVCITSIGLGADPLREGYEGMIVATGKAANQD
ncbi:MAG TPA: SCO2525 family SAM-dependent methyltransferase [Micromonosporaceae bacterium]|nr:SCO2525 family SAM-dependent methyltransferase [Micromonosporaceae bacterium]